MNYIHPKKGAVMRKRLYEIIEAANSMSGFDLASGIYDAVIITFVLLRIIPLAMKDPPAFFDPCDKICAGVFLVDYPPQAASLARVSPDAASGFPRAERWEVYMDGLELANCFTELCDRDEQARRFEAARTARRALGESEYPLDAQFLDSLPQIGSASGAALGVDRLVMVLTGVKEISAVRAEI